MEKIKCNVCLNFLAEKLIKPNDVALPIATGLLFCLRHVFQLMADVAVQIHFGMLLVRPEY